MLRTCSRRSEDDMPRPGYTLSSSAAAYLRYLPSPSPPSLPCSSTCRARAPGARPPASTPARAAPGAPLAMRRIALPAAALARRRGACRLPLPGRAGGAEQGGVRHERQDAAAAVRRPPVHAAQPCARARAATGVQRAPRCARGGTFMVCCGTAPPSPRSRTTFSCRPPRARPSGAGAAAADPCRARRLSRPPLTPRSGARSG